MFRRSNSSSHIPVPKCNLFGSRETGISSGLRRAQSSTRLSQNNEQSNVAKKPKRTASLERKSSTSRLSKLTPLSLNKPGRGQSLLKSTPGSSVMSQRSCGSRVTQSDSALKERKTIQKLSTDKHWLAEQFSKVQHFIESSQLFDSSIVTPNNIKPPSIKVFIYITSVLFREMFPNVQLTNQNYKEIIPQKLKVLHYPGTIALSVLKTVNTMHSWPQVIGMFGWLIDKINIGRSPDNISLGTLEPEERQNYLMAKNAVSWVVSRYLIFNNCNDDPDEIAAVNAVHLKNVANILEFDQEEHASLEKDIEQKREYYKNMEAEVAQLESENQKLATQVQEIKAELHQNSEADAREEAELDAELQHLQKSIKKVKENKIAVNENIAKLTTYDVKLATQVQEIKAELHQNSEADAREEAELDAELQHLQKSIKKVKENKIAVNENIAKLTTYDVKLATQVQEIKAELHQNSEADAREEAELDAELQHLQKSIKKVKENKIAVNENIAKLTEAIKTQPCSYKEKEALLKRIEALKHRRDVALRKIEQAQQIKRDFDAKLNSEIAAMQNHVIDWNRSLMEVSIKKPFLKKLMLNETGFHNPSYLDEIKKMFRLKVEIETEMADKMVKMGVELREKTAKKRDMLMEIETLEKMVIESDEEIRILSEKQLAIEKDSIKKKNQWEREKEELMKELNDPLKIAELSLLSEKEPKLQKEMENLDENVKNLCKKIVCFFVDLHKQVRHNITEMTDIMKKVEKNFEQRALKALTNQYRIMDALAVLEDLEGSSD